MDFYDRVGIVAIGSRLRRIGDRMADDAAAIYARYGTKLQPRWFPVLRILSERDDASITSIADEIGHSHASVSQIVGEMARNRYVELTKGKDDARKTLVSFTRKGKEAAAKLSVQYQDVAAAVERLLAESDPSLWEALAAFEAALATKSLYERVNEARRRRESEDIHFVEFEPRFAGAFRTLNEEWITAYFGEIEEVERPVLDDPERYIVNAGGHLFFALRNGEPVATCALVPHGEGCFELAKMAVSRSERGRGIGRHLGEQTVRRARQYGARRLYLESNTKLEPAIRLYRRLGFHEIDGPPSPYKRCNIQMEMILE